MIDTPRARRLIASQFPQWKVLEAHPLLKGGWDNIIFYLGIDTKDGPPPGAHNFFRGGALRSYEAEMRKAMELLKGDENISRMNEVWEMGVTTTWEHEPVWVHGDVSSGNMLAKQGRLCAVIDFGMLGVGDPACDLSITWTFFQGESRKLFQTLLPFDIETWARARAWMLWKALIVATGLTKTNAFGKRKAWEIIHAVIGK